MFETEAYRDFAILAVGVLAVGKMSIIGKVRAGRHISLSSHAASNRASFVVFVGCLTLASILFQLYSTRWLVPTLELSAAFTLVMTAALICVVVTAWVADKGVWSRTIHRTAAYGIVVSMPIMTALLLTSPLLSGPARYFAVAVLIGLLVLGYRLFFERRASSHFLVYQVAYFNLFFAALLGATYL